MERKALEEARDELLADPDPLLGHAEALGRTYHWLDEPEEARSCTKRSSTTRRSRTTPAASAGSCG